MSVGADITHTETFCAKNRPVPNYIVFYKDCVVLKWPTRKVSFFLSICVNYCIKRLNTPSLQGELNISARQRFRNS